MKRVLIIEDDERIAEVERDYLEANEFEVETAIDGRSGLTAALNGNFDLILLDVMLPGLDGFNVCKKLRAELETPILLVSAKREDIDKIRGLGLGADDYIVNPFSPSELIARVKAHIARYERLTGSKATVENVMRAGGLEINVDARRVFVDGREIKLTNLEFELLNFLAQHPNVVFNREVLFERIWGLEALGDSATVTVHVNRLRDKIEPDPNRPKYIETVWGAGYRFNS
ncbi:MAG: response regulator transcription factor [Selenomonadaceae bacterium]|nr:response regulator transcription factor [Selenomonadaceae bacterium]